MPEENVRPWGRYEVIEKIKIIYVNPNQQLSLQYHEYRNEDWRILSGSGEVQIGEQKYLARVGDEFRIPRMQKHRIRAGEEGLSFLEIATGEVDEDDIVRLEDDYGRLK